MEKKENAPVNLKALTENELESVAGGDAHQYDPCPRCGCPNPEGRTHCVVCHTLIWGQQIC